MGHGDDRFRPIADICGPLAKKASVIWREEGWVLQIAISGKFSNDCFDAAHEVVGRLREIVRNAALENVETDLDVVFFPVIISKEFGVEKRSHRSFSRKERAEFVNVEIDVHEWSMADAHRQLELMMNALKGAVRDTPSSRMGDAAKDAVIARLQTAYEERNG